ncbi:acyl-CoA dehydrogenase family protein [Cryptosporangium sp. NPDC048952]|uniref:acyl-CoA dehydrogenase family protein n=1 Tax=Cryptosporangium sp. NPDC048952 TaxID=3363961 RepID=UPI00371D36A7
MADDFARFDQAVDEYLVRHYTVDRRRALLGAGGFDAPLAAELADLGWYSLAVPEAEDGLGVPLSDLGGMFMQAGRHLLIGPLLENTLLPALLQRSGDGEGSDALAAAVRTGVPVALVDPGVSDDCSTDLGSVSLTGGRLHGSVAAARFAQHASLLAVVAGSVLCLVDPRADGVRISALRSADPAVSFGRVDLTGVHVDAVVGRDDTELITRIRAWARLFLACELDGLARSSLDRTVQHLKTREQFGRPIGAFQALAHIAADMHTASSGLHSLCLAALADAGDATDVAELELVAVSAKAHAAGTAVRICEDAIQLHGGMGFTTESDVSWYYKRAVALRAWYGDEQELHRRIGAALLDRATETLA